MKEANSLFIDLLKEKVPTNISVTEEVASILGINYDAAYRRLTGRVSFNINETVQLSKIFDISLNELFKVGETNSYLIRETKRIKNINDFNTYFENLYKELKPLANNDDASILFAAREIPMFYFFHNPLLVRFKIFIWFSILKTTPLDKRINFKDFVISDKMIKNAQKTGNVYNNINLTEIWSFGSINNVLQQILYMYNMRQINAIEAGEICDALISVLKKIEEKTLNNHNKNKRKYELYSNELIMMNNSMIMNLNNKMSFGYPYALLRFFIIDNQKACKTQKMYILEQMCHAICITNTSTKEHATFFNRKYDKIKQVLAVINNEERKPLFL
jgi:hypothetical protein